MRLNVPYFKQDFIYSCGPAAVQMVLAYFHIRESESNLIEELGVSEEMWSSNSLMIEVFRKRGLYCYVNKDGTLEQIKNFLEEGIPVVVNYIEPSAEDGHFAVVVNLTDSVIVLNDPWNGENFVLNREEFLNRWHSKYDDASRWYLAVSDKDFDLGKRYRPV
ncbi:MAG: hypothetical protein A2653_00295 [Candidatus Zambryskibacteria bacterium RIFCSPHIGHO2_01_FULL_43_25]|uniref:Peptidase C39 domain-containing protein n=1 Tax=Candidatus Zambryskibacteria bacterium RIFCSPLOWO2_01_FULL_45_21 TaxID=1802761 RepID=A0A1G2U4P3_9BACT|nr:MAG: hypothetical protein A2653_00295 [Candidatus Zambryskibacteria bacterium RIFCSPHIGHO2_01_FULL_43_25]OHB00671.1 MAG: hypothetical protein A3E94_03550 [Candidatus Zambryskibacteria bacterium RIFCSPHIGHO2_12_FULL_44_12b]OHB04487.1 MAG: hypothetical protein A3B14_03590 [Candidatus Zambryskibacteria bacterium RIFCSPLOWO2_01_FULL_45_21]